MLLQRLLCALACSFLASGLYAMASSDSLVSLGENLMYQQPDSARWYFKKAQTTEGNAWSLSQQADVLRKIGISFEIQGQVDSALTYLKSSLEKAKTAGDKQSIASTAWG